MLRGGWVVRLWIEVDDEAGVAQAAAAKWLMLMAPRRPWRCGGPPAFRPVPGYTCGPLP